MNRPHLLLVSAMFLSACAQHSAGPVAYNAPTWVQRGNAAIKDSGANGGSVFYGVGIVQGVKNRALAVSAADDRARGELARIMNSYLSILDKDYQASTTAGSMDKSSEEQHISQVLKNFSSASLHGSTIIDRWKDPADGTLFSLCKLDVASFKKSIAEADGLDAKVRDFVRAGADKAFGELDAEESKRK